MYKYCYSNEGAIYAKGLWGDLLKCFRLALSIALTNEELV